MWGWGWRRDREIMQLGVKRLSHSSSSAAVRDAPRPGTWSPLGPSCLSVHRGFARWPLKSRLCSHPVTPRHGIHEIVHRVNKANGFPLPTAVFLYNWKKKNCHALCKLDEVTAVMVTTHKRQHMWTEKRKGRKIQEGNLPLWREEMWWVERTPWFQVGHNF